MNSVLSFRDKLFAVMTSEKYGAVFKGIIAGFSGLFLIVGIAETYQDIGIHSLGITLLALGSVLFIALGVLSSEAEKKKYRCGSIWNQELTDDCSSGGGTSFSGETVGDFCKETGMNQMTPIWELNQALRECGINPVRK